MARIDKRAADDIRSLNITYNISEFADGSILYEIGKTKVLCAISTTSTVPVFMRGKGQWWLTASYALLPTSTKTRVERETIGKRNERSIEISRLIGRSLRAIVDMSHMISERTIQVDCDVIQADGGTRTACITGAFLALKKAQDRWIGQGLLKQPIIKEDLAAISVGLLHEKILLDIDFHEDSHVQADLNFVLTRSGGIIEIQGGAEKKPLNWNHVEQMKTVALKGIKKIFSYVDEQEVFYQEQFQKQFTSSVDKLKHAWHVLK